MDNGYIKRDLRVWHGKLAEAVTRKFGHRCPCCGNPMQHGKPRRRNPTAQNRNDIATMAHNVSVGCGGNPEVWVWACRGCNAAQGRHSFRSWGYLLMRTDPVKGARVLALADYIDDWADANGKRRDTDIHVAITPPVF